MAKMKSGFTPTRLNNEIRQIDVTLDFTPNALSSVLYRQGNTMVLACVTKERSLPRWFPRDSTKGWVHAEYSLMPASTDSRFRRERNGAKGRTQEIERLVARSLRAAVDLEALGPIALNIDCDVLNADGGTRCASITAAGIALRLAIRRLIAQGICLPLDRREDSGDGQVELTKEEANNHENSVMPNDVAAISVGLLDGEVFADLDYDLDSNADVDMNIVMTSDERFVEVQGTGEEATYSSDELNALISSGKDAIKQLFAIQKNVLSE
tara:strand:+ start:179 stop:982 length:804 start_codon:yes stop_codon:yes gene_type:complete